MKYSLRPPAGTELAESYSDNVELTRNRPSPSHHFLDDLDDIHPDSDAALLRRHRATDDSDNDNTPDQPPTSFTEALRGIMSLKPLLTPARDHPAGNYSTVHVNQESNEEPSPREPGRRRSSGARRSSISESRKSLHKASFEESFTSGVEIQAGQGKLPEGFAPLLEELESSEAVIDVDEEDSKYSEEDPRDNSMCVTLLLRLGRTHEGLLPFLLCGHILMHHYRPHFVSMFTFLPPCLLTKLLAILKFEHLFLRSTIMDCLSVVRLCLQATPDHRADHS